MRELLRILETEGPVDSQELAVRLGQSVAEVEAALADLREQGVLLRYSALVNWEKVEEEKVYAFINVSATPEHGCGFDKVAEYLSQFAEVHSLYLMSGQADLCVVVEGRDFRDIARFVAEKLAPTPGVRSTSTSFVLKTYKMEGEKLFGEAKNGRLAVSP
ncbi:MAG: Lrp/AsnC family transcriptional regulator [candidate division WS1 bacterium]|jgi:DNA-binding Lrp family transcriptional regulator|nr:Lrp/AsnC family transcriptional regulator [candidate division WS1 bacterium]